MSSIFLLSPANTAGKRAKVLMNPGAEFDLAKRLRNDELTLGETFSFLSGLYFRGKLAYARKFGASENIFVITSHRGLVSPDTVVDLDELRAFATVPIDLEEPRYVRPMMRSARELAAAIDTTCPVVLLGSIATRKYIEPLGEVFGARLVFPAAFVGRGDMSRGGLMLRSVVSGKELDYIPVATAVRKGSRPPKLEKLDRGK
ncbi:MAG TPA: hypothetical protein VMY38_07565 [Gemmatimonadaceae bacterium]|nr:hypothetical protein [Gemmatimonadaceae bacterium]